MKKLYFFLGFILAMNVVSGQLLTENFNYTAGQLITANGWTAHSGAGTNAIAVTSPGLTYSGHLGSGVGNAVTMTTSGEDDNRAFTAVNNGTVYLSFLANLSAAQTGDYFIGLFQNTSTFPLRVYAKSDGAGGFNFGVSKASSTVVYETTSRSFGTTYFIVTNYIFNSGTSTDDVVNLWVNPALGGTQTTGTIADVTGTGADGTSIAAVYLRQGGGASASTQQVDAILTGTTWAEVTPAAAVPTLSISSPLSAFGNVCINTTAGPNSFTISGTNLTTAAVTVAALTGYTYSITSGGTYTPTLNLTQPGGSYSQQIFVKFTPTVIQSYNGNIAVGGGGATSVNGAATGAGINPIPTVTSGGAGSITQNSATVSGLASFGGCSPLNSNYGIEFSTTSGFANGSGTPVLSTNIAAGAFSSNLTGLLSGTTYYYHAYASNAAGTGYGAQMSFITATVNPTINVTTLTAFSNVCTNTTAGPNSFTINGTNLTNANVTVGSLAGFTYSITSGGSYTPSLSLVQPGGTYMQQIFVKFTPTAVQSYNGNIPVAGGGVASAVNVAASGAGINTAPSVITGVASAVTTTTATLAGSITATGCTTISVYGIEYSTTNGFVNGSGTQIGSSNLAAGNFSSALSGLLPSTTYYYKAYATNGGGISYGAQQSFTTASPPPPALTATTLSAFSATCITNTTGPNLVTINGANLTTAPLSVGPLTGFTFSETSGGTYVSTLSITQAGGTQSKTVYVKFTPTAVQSYNGNIPVSGGGAATINVPVVASGVNTVPTVSTGGSSNLTNHSATLSGAITANGCSNVTVYGIEYSGISAFANGTGIKVPSTNLTGGIFSSNLTGLVQGATYYFKTYATNNGGTAYGVEQAFLVPSIGSGFTLYPVPAERGKEVRVTMDNITPGYYGLQFFNSSGQLVYQKDMNIQVNFINQTFTIPATLQKGTYQVRLVNHLTTLATKNILIM